MYDVACIPPLPRLKVRVGLAFAHMAAIALLWLVRPEHVRHHENDVRPSGPAQQQGPSNASPVEARA
ncbi:MAG: hypothetical protein JNK85_17290 [Verrucomicrobiales bacterium]|nr:hypothetical protein [Verrucomicrobiales bacterium]